MFSSSEVVLGASKSKPFLRLSSTTHLTLWAVHSYSTFVDDAIEANRTITIAFDRKILLAITNTQFTFYIWTVELTARCSYQSAQCGG
jgi:hypothetical protein